jgi:DNA ligase (NAD+)
MDYLKQMSELIDYLNENTKLYDQGNPQISDEEWDKAYFKLQNLEQESGITREDSPTQKITYKVVTKLEKVTHSSPMLSLNKTKDWDEFVRYFGDKGVIGMVKLDGLTCRLTYENGFLKSAETRGNGEVGEDILHNARVIKSIPKFIGYKEKLIVDGEVICTEDDFVPFSTEFKNPRNFASGSIRLLDSKECAKRNLTFVAWNVKVIAFFINLNSFFVLIL